MPSVIARSLRTRAQVTDSFVPEVELPLQATLYPLGYPARIQTNAEDVIRAAGEAWGCFPRLFEAEPVRIALTVTAKGSGLGAGSSHFCAREHLMSVHANRDNVMLLDFERGFVCGTVARAVAMDHPLLRYRFLIPGAHMLIEQRALMPLHGALVVRHGRGVLLTGESFAGKSTLAYACARAGWSYVTDDGTFLIRGRGDRSALGDPNTLRLREGARGFFPELSDHLAVVRPNGKIAIEVLTKDLPIRTAYGARIEHVVFLERMADGPASLEAVAKDETIESFQQHINFGTAEVRRAQRETLDTLADAGQWLLRYSALDGAIARLEQLADTGE